jgi:ferredoxin--NADP+ reductase
VRYRSDLAYLEEHRRLQDRFDNYHYLAMPTREPDVPKRYIQDLIEDGTLAKELGTELDPSVLHVFLCGNPAMIGLPDWDDEHPVFPETIGVAQQLHEWGFTLDRRGVEGNVHYEEYW